VNVWKFEVPVISAKLVADPALKNEPKFTLVAAARELVGWNTVTCVTRATLPGGTVKIVAVVVVPIPCAFSVPRSEIAFSFRAGVHPPARREVASLYGMSVGSLGIHKGRSVSAREDDR
jgi:hypothetical protein